MSGLARAVTWTQQVGYSYPETIFPAVIRDRFPRLSELEADHCVSVHKAEQEAWLQRCESGPTAQPPPAGPARV
jgi:hypothetical protein